MTANNAEKKVELLPCPFCGGTHIDWKNPYGKIFFVCCCGCGSMTGYSFSRNKAIKLWNTRTPAEAKEPKECHMEFKPQPSNPKTVPSDIGLNIPQGGMDERKILKNKQLISDAVNGDCFRACITSLFGIPNTDVLPNGGEKDWWSKWHKFLGSYGLNIHYTETDVWRNGYWIASVKSQNFSGVTHSIIMHEQEVYFDPSPNKKYPSGKNLLGENVVLGGWYFEVEDFSKLHNAIYKGEMV